MFNQYNFFLFIKFILLLNGTISHANPVIGKKVLPAMKDEFPFIVSLSKVSSIIEIKNHACGGTLISNWHVLTSAHCVRDEYLFNVMIIVGTIDFQSGKIYNIATVISYDEWAHKNNVTKKNDDNDIAIITLSNEVEGVKPAEISELTRDEVIGKKVVTAGWGFIDEKKFIRPKSLQKAYLTVLTDKEFYRNEMKLFGWADLMPSNFYYTSANPPAVTTCGDSGGPLLLASNNKIVGVDDSGCNVAGPENNQYSMSVHIAVDSYRDFIESVIKSV